MTKKVVYTAGRISCINTTPPPTVILCLASSDLLAPIDCPISGESPYDFTTIEATLTKSWANCNACNQVSYSYVFSYDENLLADPTSALTADDIVGVFCAGCLTDWVKEQIGNESYIRTEDTGAQVFVSEHGCEYAINTESAPCVVDTATINFDLVGGCVTGDVNISADAGNIIEAHADGLFAESPSVDTDLIPALDDTYDIGALLFRYRSLYLGSRLYLANGQGGALAARNFADSAFDDLLWHDVSDNTVLNAITAHGIKFSQNGTPMADITPALFRASSYASNIFFIATDSSAGVDTRTISLAGYGIVGGASDSLRGSSVTVSGINSVATPGHVVANLGGLVGHFRVTGNNGATNILDVEGSATGGATLFGPLRMDTPASTIRAGATSFQVNNNANTQRNLYILDNGETTLRSTLYFNTAAANIVGGTTSLQFNNNANTQANVLIADAGLVTFRQSIKLGGATPGIIGGTTSLLFRNNANSTTNLTIADTGLATFIDAIRLGGELRLSNGQANGIVGRDAADSAFVDLFWLDNSDNTVINSASGHHILFANNGATMFDVIPSEIILAAYTSDITTIETDSTAGGDSKNLVLSGYRRAGGVGDPTRGASLQLAGITAATTGQITATPGGTAGLKVLGNSGAITVFETLGTSAGGANLTGDLTFPTAGDTINVKTGGADAISGTVVVNGTTPVTVNTTAIGNKSIVQFGLNTVGGTVGHIPNVVTKVNGTSFNVVADASDTSTYNWWIVQTV